MVSAEKHPRLRKRGVGRGGRFFALEIDVWAKLWEANATNRMNFVVAYLVLAAGTGIDHRLTKWSTKACERHTGMGKPRAKLAIDELIQAGLVELTDEATREFPQYRLQPVAEDAEPIFLPVALVTGVATEASLLRRVRETGDPLLLRMLVDLYGLVQLDATFGVPSSALIQKPSAEYPPRRVFEIGIHVLWALRLGEEKGAYGEWVGAHRSTGGAPWADFWQRLRLLEQIGAIYYEPWVFDGPDADDEPLFPVYLYGLPGSQEDARELTDLITELVFVLSEERAPYLSDRYTEDVLVPLTAHRKMPGIRGVARMRVEADTPGRRLAFYKRKTQIETYRTGYSKIISDAKIGDFGKPLNTSERRGE